jgi:hypothetical protein
MRISCFRFIRTRESMGKYLFIAACCLIVIGGALWLFLMPGQSPMKHPQDGSALLAKARSPIPSEKVIDYGKLKEDKDKALTALMKERKAAYGIEESIDMIVKSDESIRIGEQTVPMKKILDEVRLKEGEILETTLGTEAAKEKPRDYGIHVVQAGQNIWDIHFKLLKDYYEHKGIQLSPLADEPDRLGHSSGFGKILKFSEHMVHIYNVKEDKLETDLDLIYPLSKVVIYHMGHIFALLDRIDYKDVHRIEFDGETLWLPAEQ